MDRRTLIAVTIAIVLLVLLGRKAIVSLVTKPSGFELEKPDTVAIDVDGVKVPAFPEFHPGPESWVQTTGLMCDCGHGQYVAPIVVREITVPLPPTPRYLEVPQTASKPPEPHRQYSDFEMSDKYVIWNAPAEKVFRGSDGRIFLRPKYNFWKMAYEPNKSSNALFIGSDEYSLVNGDIHYGPYVYEYR